MFSSVLVANRGEIAVRIVRTLRRMGIRSVVVASIPDRQSLAVRSADASVLLEGYSAAETYLDIDAVIAAARSQGCEAIHPGYGFLSERADFAERCAAEGIAFVGPPPHVLRGVGDKSAARQLAQANQVPVVPGWDGVDDDATLGREAARIGFPVMLKARGGGGGRGMREVRAPGELPSAIESARREALAAFGDPGLLVEKLVSRAHHVEIQVLADGHGNVIHLGERDCSVQRRHQKLIEESPSPVVDDALRAELTGDALRLARAIDYVNAGTFEFLVAAPDASGKRPFYFLEVNPRLQVEHPVTELVTGLDLVELQLRVAAGEPLPMAQEDVRFRGHAIEFRINAEDPRDGFRPSTGRIRSISEGTKRFDAGFAEGDEIPSQYDSLLAKAVVHGSSRAHALTIAERDLGYCAIAGIRTNVQLHRAIVASDTFAAGDATVDWLEGVLPTLLEAPVAPAAAWTAAAATLAAMSAGPSGTPFGSATWIGAGAATIWLSNGEETRRLEIAGAAPRGGSVHGLAAGTVYRLTSHGAAQFTVQVGDPAAELVVNTRRVAHGDLQVYETGPGAHQMWPFTLMPPPALPRRAQAATAGPTVVVAPLAGTIASVQVSVGDVVEPGQALVLLEAMKMEHRVTAPSAGAVKAVNVADRDVVREGDVLVELA
ncbi:MAG: biotin carboxylase N-terminal domain-containing protein [Anaerolineaceae bacterium]